MEIGCDKIDGFIEGKVIKGNLLFIRTPRSLVYLRSFNVELTICRKKERIYICLYKYRHIGIHTLYTYSVCMRYNCIYNFSESIDLNFC